MYEKNFFTVLSQITRSFHFVKAMCSTGLGTTICLHRYNGRTLINRKAFKICNLYLSSKEKCFILSFVLAMALEGPIMLNAAEPRGQGQALPQKLNRMQLSSD